MNGSCAMLKNVHIILEMAEKSLKNFKQTSSDQICNLD